MSNNPINDDGISLIIEGLQCNKTITKLEVIKCGFSAKGATCNSCNTGLPYLYILTLGPHVYMSDKAQLQITCFTSLKYWELQHSIEVVHVVQLVTHWCLLPRLGQFSIFHSGQLLKIAIQCDFCHYLFYFIICD